MSLKPGKIPPTFGVPLPLQVVEYFLDLAVENAAPQGQLALALRSIVLPMLEGAADANQQVGLSHLSWTTHGAESWYC